MADGPTSTPSASPTPLPTPARTSSASLSPADATLGVTASPAATSPSPSPAVPSPTPDPEAARAAAEAARARDAALLANARSLAQVIEAQARGAQDELAGLDPQIAQGAKGLDVGIYDVEILRHLRDLRIKPREVRCSPRTARPPRARHVPLRRHASRPGADGSHRGAA